MQPRSEAETYLSADASRRRDFDQLVRDLIAAVLALPDSVRPRQAGAPLLDVVIGDVRCVLLPVGLNRSAAARLSPREREVARLVASGRTNLAIADNLGISVWTVSTYLRRMFAKFEVPNRAALVAAVGVGTAWPAALPAIRNRRGPPSVRDGPPVVEPST